MERHERLALALVVLPTWNMHNVQLAFSGMCLPATGAETAWERAMSNQDRCDISRRGAEITKSLERTLALAYAQDALTKIGVPEKWWRS